MNFRRLGPRNVASVWQSISGTLHPLVFQRLGSVTRVSAVASAIVRRLRGCRNGGKDSPRPGRDCLHGWQICCSSNYSSASASALRFHQTLLTLQSALERTFLGYLRTSFAISMIGVIISQLFRLQHSPNPHPKFGFFVLGKPLAMICQGLAIFTLLTGTYRTWRVQNALVRGKAISGGFELVSIGFGVMLVSGKSRMIYRNITDKN